MKFTCYSDWSQLPGNASELFEQSEKDSIFYSRQWFESLNAIAPEDKLTLTLACVIDEDKVLAILPLVFNSKKNAYSLKHRYTTHYSLLLANNDQQILTCLAQGLIQLKINGLLLEPVAKNDHSIDNLIQVLEKAGYSCSYTFRFYNWIYRVQGESYNNYIASRPSKLRNTINRKKRKLEREHGYEIQLYTGDEAPNHMSDYYTVYNSSWKAHEQYNSFLNDIVARFSKAGWTRLAVLYINGQPVAVQLWFVCHGKASIFRLAYDEVWKLYSTGSILTSYLMEYVIDVDRVNEIDFLTGNESYKQDWMSERRERFILGCVKNTNHKGWYHQLLEKLNNVFS